MEDQKPSDSNFLKLNAKTVINKHHIRWIKEYDQCYRVCSKTNGCGLIFHNDTLKVCPNDPGYEFIKRLFTSSSSVQEVDQ
jgi:hypothetical protein